MGLYDRDYTRYNSQYHFRNAPQMRMSLPRITPAVKWLLIINVVVFFMQIMGADGFLVKWFAVYPASLGLFLQLWRLVTYQFLHGYPMHILFNMLGLFFLGPTLERHWGSKRFVIFYLSCGAAGGIFYPLLVALKFLAAGPMIGASGAILGMLAACAILFPHFVVFFFFFPVPIRVAAIVLTLLYTANLLMVGFNAGGDAAHLAGIAAGSIYVFSQSWRDKLKRKMQAGTWQRRAPEQYDLQVELDRILQKVHDFGIHSLNSKEKKILKQATKEQQMRNRY
jgi:membrane associated rhomboid family serine protease